MYVSNSSLTRRETEAYLRGNITTYGNLFESGKEKRRNMSEMLEKILSDDNIKTAYKRVYANKGAGGVDGVTINELEEYMQEHWKSIKEQIRERKYKPQPVLRVEIPKPNGGVRKLGIPTVIDRVIEQAITQVLTPIFEPEFSENSYGFRPNRRCEQAIIKLLEYFNDGYLWIVDIDLEKFFDNVPQDKLMSYVGRVIHDGDTESLIRKYLKAGVTKMGDVWKYKPMLFEWYVCYPDMLKRKWPLPKAVDFILSNHASLVSENLRPSSVPAEEYAQVEKISRGVGARIFVDTAKMELKPLSLCFCLISSTLPLSADATSEILVSVLYTYVLSPR